MCTACTSGLACRHRTSCGTDPRRTARQSTCSGVESAAAAAVRHAVYSLRLGIHWNLRVCIYQSHVPGGICSRSDAVCFTPIDHLPSRHRPFRHRHSLFLRSFCRCCHLRQNTSPVWQARCTAQCNHQHALTAVAAIPCCCGAQLQLEVAWPLALQAACTGLQSKWSSLATHTLRGTVGWLRQLLRLAVTWINSLQATFMCKSQAVFLVLYCERHTHPTYCW